MEDNDAKVFMVFFAVLVFVTITVATCYIYSTYYEARYGKWVTTSETHFVPAEGDKNAR